ncbi:alpha-protein kinase 3 [Apodemus sylvaticus]|uniref:alpha-protein kinase 3 n=1 Tax=Apodemus sylvaticus TaxID=10129 RepID=UPI002241F9DD|nr:alpha-protein kinase 3 [Apodemus sylvaticus]
MGSRRAAGRGWGLGGRAGAGGDGEDDGPVWTPGPASRSYLLSVRPEARSTFCSIIAQLTEETQPLFETTLKSRAVSEDSDVRFTCIVTGYPEPEVTWYKDDIELDRYCGLPKYEITHQGNRHTLQLYRCREEDAAIYQASARNTKGIVSCSGVLEVGTMTEYKIHQRWFAKLKRKAAAKMKEIEQSWKHGKEASGEADSLRKISPDRFQRKRRLSGAEEAVLSAPVREMEEGETESAQHPGLGLINSFAPGEAPTNGEPAPENGEDGEHGLLTYICEVMELGPQKTPPKESGAKKKRKDEEAKPGKQKPELEKAEGSQGSSENGTPSSDKPNSSRREKAMDTQPAQTQPRGRVARGPEPSGIESTRKTASVPVIQDKVQDVLPPAPVPAPAPAPVPVPAPTPVPSLSSEQVYFSLKDMFMESTRAGRSQEEEKPPPPSTRVAGESPPGKVPVKARGEKAPMVSSQPTSSMVPPPIKPLNRKRFAPPKPKVESTTTSSSSQTREAVAQSLGKALPPASTQVPTPPARRRHGTRDSPLQGQTSHRTPGENLESPAAMAPAMSASSSSDTISVEPSSSGNQSIMEPMDTETQEDARTLADGRTGSRKKPQADGKMHVDGRTQGDGAHASLRTQAGEKAPMDVVTPGSETPQSDRSSQKDLVTQRRVDTQVGQTQEGERWRQDPRDSRVQEEEETQAAGSISTASETGSERPSTASLSSQPGALTLSPSECPREPQAIECFEKSTEASCVQEKSGLMLRSEEPAFRSHEGTPLGAPFGSYTHPTQLPPEGDSKHLGGETHQRPEWLDKAKQEDSLFQCPEKEQPQETLHVDLPGGHSAGLSEEAPGTPSLPGTSLTNSLQEGLPSPAASQHISTDVPLCSGDQDVPSSTPTLQLGPGSPTQSHPPEAMATGSEGACAKEPDVDGRSSGTRSCDPGLIDSLKNYLLLLLKLSSPETSEARAESQEAAAAGGLTSSSTLVPTMEVAGLSPRTSRRILDRVENNHLLQSAQTLLLSPCTSRRLTGLLDREVQAGQQALAAAQCSRGPCPSPLSIPAIVVGEEGSAPGEGEDSRERTSQESDKKGLLGEVDGQTAENRTQEPRQEDEIPGEALTGLPAATPEELALGARRKRFLPKVRADGEANKTEERESPTVSPRGPRKGLTPGSPGTPGRERRSPTQARKASMLEVPGTEEEPTTGDLVSRSKASGLDSEPAVDEEKQEALAKPRKAKDLLKAPQVIRKIRVEQFPDSSGSLKLWCQFFNIVSDSVLTWAKDQHLVGEVSRSAGDEGPAALAIVQASPMDCGVYRCTIQNEHGSASTDFRLSPEVLSGFISREEGEVGEEIEMTPMVFAKGLADSGCWGDKLFGRLVSEELRGGGHGLQKASRAKVIYGLEPIFESGRTCIIKVSSLLVFGPSNETSLLGRNYDVTIQGCKIQNMSREYCKIFAAEARAASGFGEVPEIIPLYLIYRPANSIPYATLEEDLGKPLHTYCSRQWGCAGAPAAACSSEAMQKCQTFQHWLHQWTNGSFLVTDLAGADWKMTDVQIATKLRGYQGLKESCFPALLDQFASSHQCNTYCEMLGLKPLKGPEAAHPQAKAKGSKSPSAGRKGSQLSPQPQKKGLPSPQGSRKSTPSSKASPQASQAAAAQLLGQLPAQDRSSKAQGMR